MNNRLAIISGYLMIGIILVVVGCLWQNLPPELPWLYSLPWGEKQLVSKVWFCIGGGVLAVLFSLDLLLSQFYKNRDEVLSGVILWFGVGVVLAYAVAAIKVIVLML